jgi:hypothetical protein
MQANTYYYFYSSSSQAVAAVVGLSAALAIFRYQSMLKQINGAAETILHYFAKSDLIGHWPWDAGGSAGQQAYLNSTTANGHMNVLRHYLQGNHSLVESRLKGTLENAYRATPKEAALKLVQYRNVRGLFAKYDVMVKEARKLRRLTIIVTGFGLGLMLLGQLLTLTPESPELSANGAVLPLFLVLAGAYVLLTVHLTVIAFSDPHRDR